MKSHDARPYRADIDGLRAVAVLLVVFDHLKFRPFFGGYIGVDVFFVISGYLIGSSLIAEFSEGSFSLMSFYERRVRRIAPALMAMLAAVSGLAYAYLTPLELVRYGKSVLAATLSVSNIYFWTQSGYFDGPSATQPLLHTWSLAVEEQFYLFFPILLFAIFRFAPQRLRAVLWGLSAITLIASIIEVTRFDPSTAFYWAPLRAWELLLGVLISQYPFPSLRVRWIRECCSLLGITLIIGTGIRYTSSTSFPGWTALLPCVGAAAIIASGQSGASIVGRILSLPPVSFVGLISYSLYLWHWPLAVFQSMGFIISSEPIWERKAKVPLLIVSLLLAAISWRFIELPFRRGRFRPKFKALFASTGIAAGLLVLVATAMIAAHGLPSRLPKDVQFFAGFESYDVSKPWRVSSCFLMPDDPLAKFNSAGCLPHDPSRRHYLVFGDSTAAQLMPGLSSSFPEIQFQQATAGRCAPIEYQKFTERELTVHCNAMWSYVHQAFLPTQRPDAVILAAQWFSDELPQLDKEIERWRQLGVPVTIFGPPLEFDSALPELLASQLRQRNGEQVREAALTRHFWSAEVLDMTMRDRAIKVWKVRYISYFDVLCSDRDLKGFDMHWKIARGCPLLTSDGVPLLFDQRHLTIDASKLFVKQLRDKSELQ